MVFLRLVRRFANVMHIPKIPKDIYGAPVDPNLPHQSSKLTHLSNGEEWVHKIPPIIVDDDVVRCGGVKTVGLGHPVVYIKLDKRKQGQVEKCKWCGLRYQKNPALIHHHHEH
ncbi:unnamed protein product [Blepharisma stoltei]|uniref:C2H2-type domain-containing protein n=1 Tax=Blepharisma stoltei TaxID=1481888 RepID=A0AAU9JWN4_9CILI|nr:unnamed protein product [Blepharisma stoltei]